jgi:hypothetical protein
VDVAVIKEGTVPMLRDLEDDETCTDFEFQITPLEQMPTPEFRD